MAVTLSVTIQALAPKYLQADTFLDNLIGVTTCRCARFSFTSECVQILFFDEATGHTQKFGLEARQ